MNGCVALFVLTFFLYLGGIGSRMYLFMMISRGLTLLFRLVIGYLLITHNIGHVIVILDEMSDYFSITIYITVATVMRQRQTTDGDIDKYTKTVEYYVYEST